jgi:hypothetical protein
MPRLALPLALLAALAALAACGDRPRSMNPFSRFTANEAHCRSGLDYLVSRERERIKISIEDVNERPRDTLTAVTIVYVQGESRRLLTCLYQPDRPGQMVGGSYRGQALTPQQLQEVNAAAGRR